MLGTLDFTGLEVWALLNFFESTALNQVQEIPQLL